MKIKDAVRMLNEYYKPDDELFIVWWDKDSAQSITSETLSNEDWTYIMDYLDTEDGGGDLFVPVHVSIQEAHNELKEEKANG
jgi:hypothetical protein